MLYVPPPYSVLSLHVICPPPVQCFESSCYMSPPPYSVLSLHVICPPPVQCFESSCYMSPPPYSVLSLHVICPPPPYSVLSLHVICPPPRTVFFHNMFRQPMCLYQHVCQHMICGDSIMCLCHHTMCLCHQTVCLSPVTWGRETG